MLSLFSFQINMGLHDLVIMALFLFTFYTTLLETGLCTVLYKFSAYACGMCC